MVTARKDLNKGRKMQSSISRLRYVVATLIVFYFALFLWQQVTLNNLKADFFSYWISVGGVFLAVIYMLNRNPEQSSTIPDLENKLKLAIIENNKNLEPFLKDYEITNNEIQRRENTTMLVGSFLITASLLLLANTAVNTSLTTFAPFALTSIGLYTVWLFVLYDTGARLSSIAYTRIHTIEKVLGDHLKYDFGVHRHLLQKTRKKSKIEEADDWLEIRRYFWGMILLLLSISWLILSIIKL